MLYGKRFIIMVSDHLIAVSVSAVRVACTLASIDVLPSFDRMARDDND